MVALEPATARMDRLRGCLGPGEFKSGEWYSIWNFYHRVKKQNDKNWAQRHTLCQTNIEQLGIGPGCAMLTRLVLQH